MNLLMHQEPNQQLLKNQRTYDTTSIIESGGSNPNHKAPNYPKQRDQAIRTTYNVENKSLCPFQQLLLHI